MINQIYRNQLQTKQCQKRRFPYLGVHDHRGQLKYRLEAKGKFWYNKSEKGIRYHSSNITQLETSHLYRIKLKTNDWFKKVFLNNLLLTCY